MAVHGRAKQGAAFGYTEVRGYHPQLATCARVPSNSDSAAPARSTAMSSMLSPPASIDPITDTD